MRWLAGAAVLLAIGAGLGTYFALRGTSSPPVSEAQQSVILEQAKSEGVIQAYRVRRFNRFGWDYRVIGAGIRFHTPDLAYYCGGENAGPCFSPVHPLLYLEYRPPAAAQAYAIQRIAQTHIPKAHIKVFEVTTFG
jgi:hypothetical protein